MCPISNHFPFTPASSSWIDPATCSSPRSNDQSTGQIDKVPEQIARKDRLWTRMPPDVAGAIREIVGKPQSEAVQLAGLRALARNGSREDVAWLETVPARTPVAHRALLDAQRVLQEKPEN